MNQFKFFILISFVFVLFSCNKQENSEIIEESVKYELCFNGGVAGFDASILKSSNPATRLTDAGVWENGDVLYIIFTTTNRIVSAQAEYIADKNIWELNLNAFLPVAENMACQVVYIEGGTLTSANQITLSPNSALYEDTNARYSVNEDRQITLTADLSPKTSRVRFKKPYPYGHTVVHSLYGLTTYDRFDPNTGKFHISQNSVSVSYTEDSLYSSYYYGTLSLENRRLYILNGGAGYTRYCEEETFQIGKSGQMEIGSLAWQSGLHFNVEGVEFAMISIVTSFSNSFYGETEVTEELYQTVNGNPSNSQLPQTNISYNEAIAFVDKLSTLLPFTFCLPDRQTVDEISQRSTFDLEMRPSGYNPDDYAWTSNNCNSLQVVKTRFPIELGLYDFQGNASEWLQDATIWGSSYFSETDWLPYEEEYQNNPNDFKAPNIGFRLSVLISRNNMY